MNRSSLYDEARAYLPGGVNSPVRAFKSVGGDPIFVRRAQGPFLWDESGKRYIDYVGSWGPMVLGHAHPEVIKAVKLAADDGLSFGAPTRIETAMAKRLCELIPSVQKIRMVSSGTEATMSAIRLARGFTGRDKIVKFEGCYHGHADSLLVKAGSGALTLGVPTSPGVPASLAQHTITVDYNNIEAIRRVFAQWGAEIAALIVEPVAGNMNCVPPLAGFLAGLRELCDEFESVLIFDEVMTGFRVGLTGAQGLYGITPDLTCFGKVIGGGMPVGAFGGRADIMDHVAPDGPVYQAGTLSGNPVAMTAGLKTLELIGESEFFDRLTSRTAMLAEGLAEVCRRSGISACVQHVGGMFGLFFTDAPEVTSFTQVMACDVERFKKFFHACLDEGIYLAPSAFEAGFVSAAHTETEIEATLAAAERACQRIR